LIRENEEKGSFMGDDVGKEMGLTNRSWSRTLLSMFRMPNAALKWILAGAVIFLAIVLYVPYVKDLFHFSTLHFIDLVICLITGIISILWFEGFKILKKRRSLS
jgi:Ca2+-transporting ATPase